MVGGIRTLRANAFAPLRYPPRCSILASVSFADAHASDRNASMEQTQWSILRCAIRQITRRSTPLPRAIFSDYGIACFYFWGVMHDRPMTWAIDPRHHHDPFRPRRIPSISQLNRRIASERFQLILQQIHEALAGNSEFKGLFLDGQALCVGPCSQDRDARKGHIPGGMGRGYKLHAVMASDGNIPVFSVMPLNHHEMPIAGQMLGHLRHDLTGTLVMADGNYDSHRLHKYIASRGAFLITHPRGRAKHPVTRRQMGSARRTLIDLWDHHPKLMARVYRYRQQIERRFGNLACIPTLLNNLPKFVRGLPRVRRFVGAKICLYHAHRQAKNGRTEPV